VARTNRNRSGSTGRPGRSSGGRDASDTSRPTRPEDEEFVEYDPDADDADLDEDEDLDDEDPQDDEDLEDDDDPEDDELEDDEDPDEDDEEPRQARQGTRVAGQRATKKRPTRKDKKGTPRSPLGSALDEGGRTNRRAKLASLEARQRRTHRLRVAGLVTVCVVLAAAVLAWPTYLYVSDAILRATPRNQLGVSAANAGCLPDEKNPATGNQEHVEDGTVVPYPRLPPDSGPHYNVWAPFGTTFYDMSDRPAIENLVHNLEHGYTILWYDVNKITPDELKQLKVLASTYDGTDPRVNKFIAAPWKTGDQPGDDGGSFPEGTRFIMVRWVANPDDPGNTAEQYGVRQACGELSGEALEQFMVRYPQPSSPEPNGG